MNETFSVVKNFVQSLENGVLNTDQEAVLFCSKRMTKTHVHRQLHRVAVGKYSVRNNLTVFITQA